MAKRVYQAWKGRNVRNLIGVLLDIYFWKEVIFGPDARSLLVTILLTVVPVVIFCTNVARNLDVFAKHKAGYSILVVAIVFTIYVLVLLLLTSARDPGTVPHSSHPPEEELCYDSSTSIDIGGRQTPTPQMPHKRYHCKWFVCEALLCMFVFAISALQIKFLTDHHGNVLKARKGSPASVILMVYCFIFLWFVGGLSCFHLYLMSKNQTTYENFHYGAANSHNVYNRGCIHNLYEVFCTRTKCSKINFCACVQEESPLSFMLQNKEANRNDLDLNHRVKVEGNLEIDNDLLKFSQHCNVEEADNV